MPSPWVAPGLVRFADAKQDHPYQREEIFGPEAALYPVVDLDHAIAAANDSDYGARRLGDDARPRPLRILQSVASAAGILNWNRGTIGASGRLPFGGGKRSGNDRPAGILSTVYCSRAAVAPRIRGRLRPDFAAARDAATVSWHRTVLMGDPSHFSVKGGANPHTRTWLGTRRSVDRDRARSSSGSACATRSAITACASSSCRADPGQPGLVYPANAGFLLPLDAEKPRFEKLFYLSNLIATRAGERTHYDRVVRATGFRTAAIPEHLRFEGEADFFPAGDVHLLTHGRLEDQRFVPRVGIPPWKRVYGFRTDARVEPFLAPLVAPRPVLRVELVLEAHYHGDTALCAFGPHREHLLAWTPAIAPESWERLRESLRRALIELSDEDAARYAANSFTYTPSGQRGAVRESFLFLPGGVSDRLLGQVRERGTTPITVDVSEFLKKGGGSVKCMIGDLGPVEVA